ncbi:50S ribosomal protein L11 methyltransferase [Curvivirga sp.]|uniref:50S ribosomal protein L11 methyltransferase n=1 Tax=Curvivirga sp. TaxID=2856848 RepID=UPI003B59E969
MTAIASQPIYKLELFVDTEDAAEIFATALENFVFAAAAFEVLPDIGPWRYEGYIDGLPDHDSLVSTIALASIQAGVKEPDFTCLPLPDKDWVAENQKSFNEIEAGRFFIYPSVYEGIVPSGSWPLKIDAATAFGTGEHATTKGCLMAISDLSKYFKPENPLDLGCGTGILAMGMAKAWRIPVFASDIDPEAVRVTNYNARLNQLQDYVTAVTSAGFRQRALSDRAPYDLIVANILANPLRKMSKDLASRVETGGYIILSGLLNSQETAVLRAYRQQNVTLEKRYRIDGWSALLLRK